MNDEPVCGCKSIYGQPVRHKAVCDERGWSAMATKEEVEADKKKLELEELQEEADAKISELKEKAEQYAVIAKAGIRAVHELRPTVPFKEMADELRALFKEDLAPFGALFRDAGAAMLWESSKSRADVVKRLFNETGLPMDICVQLVITSANDLSNALKNLRTSEKNEKK